MSQVNRRSFIRRVSSIGTAVAVGGGVGLRDAVANAEDAAAKPASGANAFASRWDNTPDRVWVGPEYWANPLQDWQVKDGRLECAKAAANRSLHLLTRDLAGRSGKLEMRVRVGRVAKGAINASKGSAGFRIGAQGPLAEYRNNAVFGAGLDAGLSAQGLFIGRVGDAAADAPLDQNAVELRLNAEPAGKNYRITLSAHDIESGKALAEVSRDDIPANRLVGNVALVANYPGPVRPGRNRNQPQAGNSDRFWFANWQVGGDKVDAHDDRAFGPVLFAQYTLSRGVLKMTAQMPPVGESDSQEVLLQIAKQGGEGWQDVGRAKIESDARVAAFRIAEWNDQQDVAYRLVYTQRNNDGSTQPFYFGGKVRRDPVDRPVLTVADVSCNIHAAFPNVTTVEKMAALDPDLLAFTGDQFYESTGGFGTQRSPLGLAILDYLRKWYMHGWTWRELMRDRPSISIPDDHDVYQGNIWGEGGAARTGTQEMGGYGLPAPWVAVVHRTQTSHHADPFDPKPIKQGLLPYYGPMTYGRVSFAIIADRMFKSGPEGKVPPTGGRGDHVKDPDFDPKTADLPGLVLLGDRQMDFLRDWAGDWRGADMKAVISQTIFTAMATTHGQGRERLRADYDANGWPQTPRNEALREIRKAFAVHLAGDQHLPAVIQYGVDAHRDGPVAFAGPAVNVGYPRWFEPEKPGENRAPGAPKETGDFADHFGNPLTVMALANGAIQPRDSLLERMHDKTSGIGLVRFDKQQRKITFECWPYLADVAKPGTQFDGWPITVDVLDNYGRRAAAHLPTIKVSGMTSPVVRVVNEKTKEVEYSLRIAGNEFRPHVFDADATYTIEVGEQEPKKMRSLSGVKPAADGVIELKF